MNGYKKWSGIQREESLRLFKLAQKAGLIKYPRECSICGQTKGILMTHNKNYDVTLKYLPKLLEGSANEMEIKQVHEVLMPICWRCHMILHSYKRNPNACREYFNEVKNGKQYPPVYKHDFDVLKENGF